MMIGKKARAVARELSALRGVSEARAIFEYGHGGYGVLVESVLTGGSVLLASEEAVELFKHNRGYWLQREVLGDGKDEASHEQAKPADGSCS